MAGYTHTAYWVFIDEFGSVSPKDTSSDLYIATAILVKDSDKTVLEDGIEKLCQELCGGAELKSSKIGNDYERRKKFLNGIRQLPFQYVFLTCSFPN